MCENVFAKNVIVTITIENGDVVPRGVAVKTFVVEAVIGALLTTAERAPAADDIVATRSPTIPFSVPSSTWTGLYAGSHLGYAWGSSNWTASTPALSAPSI